MSPVLSAPTVLVKTRVRAKPASRASRVRTAMSAAAPATPWATFLAVTPPPRGRPSAACPAVLCSWVSPHARSPGQAAEPVQFAQSGRRLDDRREADLLAG